MIVDGEIVSAKDFRIEWNEACMEDDEMEGSGVGSHTDFEGEVKFSVPARPRCSANFSRMTGESSRRSPSRNVTVCASCLGLSTRMKGWCEESTDGEVLGEGSMEVRDESEGCGGFNLKSGVGTRTSCCDRDA